MSDDVFQSDQLSRLNVLAETLIEAEEIVERHRDELAGAEKERKNIEAAIVRLIEEADMTIPPDGLNVPTKNGRMVKIKDLVCVDCSVANMPRLIRWLDENGEAGLVKRELKLAFNREQGEEALALRDELKGKYPAVDCRETVNKQTLGAWTRRRLEDGEEIPDVLSLHVARYVRIS